MALKIFPSTQKDREQIFIQTLLNNTDRVTKVSDLSVLSGLSKSIAKISGKAEKDIILAMSALYPENSSESTLDLCADVFACSPRFGASESSTYIRIVADEGTEYVANTNLFNSLDGIQFALEEDVTIGVYGFTYAKVRSLDSGAKTNVHSGRITTVNPQPTGHKFVVNEYTATGGRDSEDDNTFRTRIKEGANILATGTLGMLTQAFMKINTNVLRIFYQGIDDQSRIRIGIVTQNGIDLNQSELDTLLEQGNDYFNLTSMRAFGRQSYGIILSNIQWQPIDISFRCSIYQSFNVDDVRLACQIALSKYLDFRYWAPGSQSVDYVNLIEICRTTPGMKSVPDNYFFPVNDIATDRSKLPRLRGFILMNLSGNIIAGNANSYNPVFYPSNPDFSIQQTALRSIS